MCCACCACKEQGSTILVRGRRVARTPDPDSSPPGSCIPVLQGLPRCLVPVPICHCCPANSKSPRLTHNRPLGNGLHVLRCCGCLWLPVRAEGPFSGLELDPHRPSHAGLAARYSQMRRGPPKNYQAWNTGAEWVSPMQGSGHLDIPAHLGTPASIWLPISKSASTLEHRRVSCGLSTAVNTQHRNVRP